MTWEVKLVEGARAGEILRSWRRRRGMSQQTLAEAAEISTRHLSCVETGKARPSVQVLLVLGSALEIPLRDRNLVLQAAGHPPAYRETDFGAEEMAPIRTVIDQILTHSEPNPVVVMNGAYEIITLNKAMAALAFWLLDGVPAANGYRLIFTHLRPWIVNFAEVASASINRLHREALHTGDPRLVELYESLAPIAPPVDWSPVPVALPLVLEKDGRTVSMYSTLTTLGTPTDVTTSEIRIETYYPIDASSKNAMQDVLDGFLAVSGG